MFDYFEDMNKKPPMEFLDSIDSVMAGAIAQLSKKSPELVDPMIQRLYGEIYQRDKLTLRERFLVTIAVLMVSGQMQNQLLVQARLALKSGITHEELTEVALQISVFYGFPCALNGMFAIESVADQLELES